MSKRDNRYGRVIGTRPYSGRRYVQDGKVRIEWSVSGKRSTRTIGPNTKANRDLADQILTEALDEVRARACGKVVTPQLTLAELLREYRDDAATRPNNQTGKRLRPQTLDNYQAYERTILRDFDGAMSAGLLRHGNVRVWMKSLRERGIAEGSIGRTVSYLKSAYTWAVGEMEFLESNPLSGIRKLSRRGEKPVYTEEEMELLLKALAKIPAGRAWRFHLIVQLIKWYGARANQAINLRWEDVDLHTPIMVTQADGGRSSLTGTIVFCEDVHGSKGQPDRRLPLLPPARKALLMAWEHRRQDSSWVAWNWRAGSRPSTYDSMNHRLRTLECKAGVSHVKGRAFHAFRRALSNHIVLKKGVSQASAWIGDTPEVLMREYVQPGHEAKVESTEFMLAICAEEEKNCNGTATEPNSAHSGCKQPLRAK
ncbi:tyrosine-type recombinase/integrase [Gemmatimonadota bacterium]